MPSRAKGEIRRCDDCRLAIVQAQPLDREVTGGSGDRDVNLILDRPGMAAVAYAQKILTIIGTRGNEDYVSAHFADLAAELWKLGVVADQDGNAAVAHVKHPQVMARTTFPLFLFPARQMILRLLTGDSGYSRDRPF